MTQRISTKLLALLLTLCLLLPLTALAGEDSRAAMDAYWNLVGGKTGTDPLTRAMNGEYAAMAQAQRSEALTELKAVTADDLLAFAADHRLPVEMAQYAWYTAMADCLSAALAQAPTGSETETTLTLFLAMGENARDSAANSQRRSIRKGMTEAEIDRISGETGLPGGFLAWLLLDDEWHEGDWDGVDDWREGRSKWTFADWVTESDLRSRYGKSAVVDEDDVEALLRKNGLRFDD